MQFRPDAGAQLVSRPAPNPVIAPGFANNDLTRATPPTVADPDAWNSLIAETENLLTMSGQIPSKTLYTQLLQALLTLNGLRGIIGSAPGGGVTASWSFLGNTHGFNGATTGAGGMDTGVVPTAADLNFYAIYNPTTGTWSVIGTIACNGAVYTGTYMPSGYTASRLIGAVVTSAGHVPAFYQTGRVVYIANSTVLSAGTASSPTPASVIGYIPVAARWVAGNAILAGGVNAAIGGNSILLGFQIVYAGAPGNFGPIPTIIPTEIFFQVLSGGSLSISLDRYAI